MYQTCSVVCKVEEFKPTSNNFRTEFIGKDWTGRKQYRGISFKKTQFGNIEDINYYPLIKEFIEIAGKAELLKTIKDYCREHCVWLFLSCRSWSDVSKNGTDGYMEKMQ